jgi:hypothetical protein
MNNPAPAVILAGGVGIRICGKMNSSVILENEKLQSLASVNQPAAANMRDFGNMRILLENKTP